MSWLRDIDKWFAEAVLPYAAHYRAYARRFVADVADADDLVQEAYAKILTVSEWRRLEAPDRFLLTIIRNLAYDRLRRQKVLGIRQIAALELDAVPDPAPDAHTQAGSRQELEIVLAAVEQLPRQCRKVLMLRKVHGLSPAQIASKLHLSVSTVEKHVARGLRLLTLRLAAQDQRSAPPSSSAWRTTLSKTENN